MRKFRIFAYLMLCLALMSGMALAQAPTAAKILGVVTDETGTVLPGVSVEATCPKVVGKVTAITDASGTYRLLGLLPGTYQITFSLAGFKTVVRRDVVVNIEQTIALDIKMPMGTIEEEVTVIGKSPLIDVKSTTKGMTLTKEVFEYLPKGRDFATLVSVIPGVQTEAKFGGGISVDGSSSAENMYYVDGMETSDIRGGRQAQRVAFEFIDEIQVKAAGYQAEYGGSMGGVVQVITRSGGNEFHGELLGYFSGSMLTGKERDTLRLQLQDSSKSEYINYYDYYEGLGLQPKDYSTRIEAGFNLGGYIIRDRLWFFGSLLPIWNKTNREVQFQDSELRGSYDTTTNYLNYQAKVTAAPVQGLRLSASYVNNFHKVRGLLPAKDGSDNPDYAWGDYGFDYPNMTAAATADYTLGSNLLFSARGGYFYQDQNNQQAANPSTPCWRMRWYVPTNSYPEWPADLFRPNGWQIYSIDDIASVVKEKYTRTSTNLDITYFLNLAGEHSIKGGFQFVRLHDDKATPNSQPYIIFRVGNTHYNIDGSAHKGKYGFYEVHDPYSFPYGVNAFSNRFALYLQDSWTIARKLTLNFGLRTESEKVPAFSTLPEYKDKIPLDFSFGDKLAPRFGFIYDVFGDSSLKVYGSYGILQDCMKLAMPEGSYGGDQWWGTYYTLDTYQWDTIGVNGYYPGEYLEHLNWRTPSIDATDPNIKPVSQREISFGVEKQLVENLSLSVRFTQRHLIRAIEDIGFMTPEGEGYTIANPGFYNPMADPKFPLPPKAKRDYTGINFTLEKRLSNNWLAGFGYTYSHLTGNFAGLDSSDEPGRNDPNVNRYWDGWFQMLDGNLKPVNGVLPTDRPHYFKAYGSYVFPFGLNVGVAAFAYSGIPVTTQVQFNNMQWLYPNGRFDLGYRTPFTFFMNLYAEYNLKLSNRYSINLNVNVDNITNTKTAQYIYQTYGQDIPYLTDDDYLAHELLNYKSITQIKDPRYLQKYEFYNPMSIRLGVKFVF